MEYQGLSKKIAEYVFRNEFEVFNKDRDKEYSKLEKAMDKALKDESDASVRQRIEEEFKEQRELVDKSFSDLKLQQLSKIQEIRTWISGAAQRARQIRMVTHPVKYTHNQISKATSCYFSSEVKQPGNVDDNFYITSASLKNPALDFDGNAAVLDVAKFLLLQDNDKKLLNYVRKKDGSPLKPFAESDAQLLEWLDGLGNAFLTGELSSHKLAKQIYFPVGSGRYHLLSPLYSSTISQAIFEKVEFSKYSDEMKSARAARKKGSHSFQTVIAFPSLAIQSFGGTKPQNISLMNSVRHGKAYLLSCQPPSWTTQDKPPLGVKTVFSYNYFSKRVWKQVRSLKDFLERYAARTSTITIRDRRSAHIDELVDELIQFAAEIQNMGSSGWSVDSDCKLPLVEQLWLDKGRALVDPDFALEREKADWKADIASCFATWLNKRLKSEKLVLSDVEHNEWQSLLEKKLRLLKDDLEVLS